LEENQITDEQLDMMVKRVLSDERMTKKMLNDFGYKVKDYNPEDLAYIVYVITQQGGLKDQVKVSKAVYMVDQIAKYSTQHKKYEDVGRFAMDILQECGVINFNK
jgi:hypothetical protein